MSAILTRGLHRQRRVLRAPRPYTPLGASMTALLLVTIVLWTFGYRSVYKRAIG